MRETGSAGRIWLPLATLGLAHAAVDGACAAMLLGAVGAGRLSASDALLWFVVYNVVAFALQPAAGLLVDRFTAEKPAGIAGALLTAAAVPLSLVPGLVFAAIGVAGVGNALFHVGGGAASLRMAPGKTFAAGIFVAPGAAGLALGTLLGKAGGPLWLPVALLVGLAVALAALRTPAGAAPVRIAERATLAPTARVEVAVLLVLLVVAMRSFAGFAIAMPWKSQLPLLAALTTAVVLGKALGGVLADRFGRARIAVGGLAVSAPLLVLAGQFPIAGVVGMFAFNMTMPVTVVAVYEAVPEFPGFAFGLASLAIVAGAFPLLAGLPIKLAGALPIALAVGGSAVALGVALWWLGHPAEPAASPLPVTLEMAE